MGLQADYGIAIKLNGGDISDHVVSYNWTKKVCTGIGTLTLEVENSIFTDIGISDVITIYEDSTLAFTGYVQRNSNDYNNGIALVECQDKSKFLIDYFIAESYLVDYASYSRTWIEQFLTEAQISYTFLTEENGTLISNNTSLGMMSAYDQVMNLLQQSGWYIGFDASGTASIGKLTAQISGSVSINKSRIINVELLRDDKMLRNRAVVWGNANPLTGTQVYADVYRPTVWDIDSYDRRAFLIANSNIPNIYSAYVLANVGLDEFTKITEEKHITVESLLDVSFATRVYVTSDVFNGSGIVTTYGTSMGEGGLVTNIILDERCPRLFGSFYDFGDYVYVGTDGAGIKRKQLESGTWYDYSTGINDLHISDLYKKKDLLVCVTVSGEAYRAYGGSASWTQLNIPPLESDLGVISSGLFPRACILDKTSNNIRLLVDNREGGNDLYEYDIHADYINAASSGAGSRAWVLDYTANGTLLDSYQVTTSGEDGSVFIYAGADLENDGLYDYVSVVTSGYIKGNWIHKDFGSDLSGNASDITDSTTAFYSTATYPEPVLLRTEYSYRMVEDSFSSVDTIELKRMNFATLNDNRFVIINVDNEDVSTTKEFTNPAPIEAVYCIGSCCLSSNITRFFLWYKYADEVYYVDCLWEEETTEWGELDPFPIPYNDSLFTTTFRFDGKFFLCETVGGNSEHHFEIWVACLDFKTSANYVYDYFTTGEDDAVNRYIIGGDMANKDKAYCRAYNGVVKIMCPYVKLEYIGYSDSYFHAHAWLCDVGNELEVYLGSDYNWDGNHSTTISRWNGMQYNRSSFLQTGYIWASVPAPYYSSAYYITENNIEVVSNSDPNNNPIPSGCYRTTIQDNNTTKLGNASAFVVSFDQYYYVTEYGDAAGEFNLQDTKYTTIFDIFGTVDANDGELYGLALHEDTGIEIVKFSADGVVSSHIPLGAGMSSGYQYVSFLHGSWLCILYYANDNFNPYGVTGRVYYISHKNADSPAIWTKILKRSGDTYEIIKEGAGTAYTLEISNDNPLMAHTSRNLYSLDLYNTGYEEWIDMNAGSINYKDGCFEAKYCYRQEDLESESHFNVLYTTGPVSRYSPTFRGVKKIDLDPYYNQEEGNTENFSQLLGDGTEFITMSGGRWVETTNYKYPYQYIFVASSGLPCKFYQQNDGNLTINDYSTGLPASSPITIIRIDDSI